MDAAERQRVLEREVVYDGEKYSRENLQEMVGSYEAKHSADLKQLTDLRKAHDEIAREMTRDLADAKSVWDYVKGMITDEYGQFSNNVRGILEKVPLLSELVADRPLSDLLREKVEIAERRTREIGQFLATIERGVRDLQGDIARLNKKVVVAAHNEEKAALRVLELRELEAATERELEALGNDKAADYREMKAEADRIKQLMWEAGAELRLYSNAEDRIATIVAMNNNFLQILTNLHSNMQTLHDTGLEVLDELRGNLSGLSTAAEASELSIEMQEAMSSLRASVNKVAALASNTSLFLTQNIERLTSEMKFYDEATEQLVASNLAAEREIQEQRINETIALAEREYGLMQEARAEPTAGPSETES